jgi:hypothetical protein
MLYTNHFQLRADRGFNAFKTTNNNQLWGENDFNIKGYLDKPQGLVDFQNAYNRISRIYKCGCSIILSSTSDKYIYAITDCDNYNFFHNRLFPNLCN